jgi:hypothetical protein
MAERIALDVIPQTARPNEVETAIQAAEQMRARAREAAEAVAAAQAAVDEREREDVEAAAARARAGEPLGTQSRALVKARETLQLAQRDLNAVRLAQTQIEAEVAQTIDTHGDGWLAALNDASEHARARATEALAAFETAVDEAGAAAGAAAWLTAARADGRYDRRVPTMLAGTVAPSSQRATANGAPLQVDALVAWLREAIAPPAPTAEATDPAAVA